MNILQWRQRRAKEARVMIERRRLLWVWLMNHPEGSKSQDVIAAVPSIGVDADLQFLKNNGAAMREPGGLWFAIAPKWQQEMFGFEDKKHEKKEKV